MKSRIAAALSDALGISVAVFDLTPVAGGSINDAARAATSEGTFFVKWNARPIPDQFDREAEGLDALRSSATSLRVPRPICWRQGDAGEPGFLVLEDLGDGRPVANCDERFGQGLAELHRTSTDAFGFVNDNYCGATVQPNPWTEDWVTFYGEHRLRHLLHLARATRTVSAADFAAGERLIARLPELLGDPEPPALIHGDLWAGNRHVTAEGLPAVLDPAAYYAHREAELGMMNLFGGFGPRVWAAYEEAYPLQPGWRERLPLYELYHVLNHYVLFGGGYGAQAFGIVRQLS